MTGSKMQILDVVRWLKAILDKLAPPRASKSEAVPAARAGSGMHPCAQEAAAVTRGSIALECLGRAQDGCSTKPTGNSRLLVFGEKSCRRSDPDASSRQVLAGRAGA